MDVQPGALEASTACRRFPIWPGVLVGLAVALGLRGAELNGFLPVQLGRTFGGAMVVAHGLAAFTVVTLLGDALTIAGWDRALGEWLGRPSDADSPDSQSGSSIDQGLLRAAIERNTRSSLARGQRMRQIYQAVAYVVPLIGFGVTFWGAGNATSWWVERQPLLLSLMEACFLLILTMAVASGSAVVREGWMRISGIRNARSAGHDSAGGLRSKPESA